MVCYISLTGEFLTKAFDITVQTIASGAIILLCLSISS